MRIRSYLPAALVMLAMLFITQAHGLGLTPDALSYLGAADSLAHGAALRVPIADWNETQSSAPLRHFPPLFSALLAVPIALGLDATDAARWLQALLAGAMMGLACQLTRSVCPAAAARAALPLTAAPLLVTPAWNGDAVLLLSEPRSRARCIGRRA